MKEEVAKAVAAWIPALALPPAPPGGGKDLEGKSVRVAKFTEEETIRFFFPKRTLPFQQRMVKTLASILRKRGAKIESVQLTRDDYARWLLATEQADSAETRYRYATELP